jgi:hypothetical protein
VAYQFGLVPEMKDPFFRHPVLLPMNFVALVSLVFLGTAIGGLFGSERRWRSNPGWVLLNGVVIIPAGLLGMSLISMGTIASKSGSSFLFIIAFLLLVLSAMMLDEVTKAARIIFRTRSKDLVVVQEVFPKLEELNQIQSSSRPDLLRLMGCGLIGLGHVLIPWFFGEAALSAYFHAFFGSFLTTTSIMAFSPSGRVFRSLGLICGFCILVLSIIFPGLSLRDRGFSVLTGLAVVYLIKTTRKEDNARSSDAFDFRRAA